MEVTSSLFAPVMIGSSAGIFSLMESTGSSVSGGMMMGGAADGGAISAFHFILMTGGYLIFLSISTTLTLHRLETGMTSGGWYKVPKRIVQASVAFTIGVCTSMILF
jgi:hypothetical protein